MLFIIVESGSDDGCGEIEWSSGSEEPTKGKDQQGSHDCSQFVHLEILLCAVTSCSDPIDETEF